MNRDRTATIHLALVVLAPALVAGCSAPAPRLESPTQDPVAAHVQRLVGAPYRYGGTGQGGFDCSGLVWYVFQAAGVQVPRTARAQLLSAAPVPLGGVGPGDLLFFDPPGPDGLHVGVYVGDGRFVHASSSRQQVAYSDLNRPYWQEAFLQAGTLRPYEQAQAYHHRGTAFALYPEDG